MHEKSSVLIQKFTKTYEERLFRLLDEVGWEDYSSKNGRGNFQKVLETSITYLILEDDALCGYIRCRTDNGFGIYVYDLLVAPDFRGKEYGRLLLEKIRTDFPNEDVYVMSDVDEYYTKLGYTKAGSIFEIPF